MLNAIKHKIWPYMFTLGLFICNTAFANAVVPASNQQKLKEELQQLYLQDGAIIIGSVAFAFLLVHLCKKIRSQKLAVFLKASIVVIAVLFNSVWLFLSCNTYIDAHLRLGTKEQIAHVVGDVFSPNFPSTIGGNMLYRAVFNNYDIGVIKQLLDMGADVNTVSLLGRTPLSYAAYHSSPEVIALLVDNGADVNVRERDKDFTPLMAVLINDAMSSKDKEKAIKILLKAGADIEATDRKGSTALDKAAIIYHTKRHDLSLQTIKVLLDTGADINHAHKYVYKNKEYTHTPYITAQKTENQALISLFEQYRNKESDM